MNKLQVDDIVYILSNSRIKSVETITKVTKTIARSSRYNFDINISENGFVKIKGQNIWDINSAKISNPVLQKQLLIQNAINFISSNKFVEFIKKDEKELIRIYNKYI